MRDTGAPGMSVKDSECQREHSLRTIKENQLAISTDDCKKALVEFIKTHPDIIRCRFQNINEIEFARILDINRWKRAYKCKPDAETDTHNPVDAYMVHTDGCSFNRWGDPSPMLYVDSQLVKYERGFDYSSTYDGIEIAEMTGPDFGELAFIVLETKTNGLIIGEYIGD